MASLYHKTRSPFWFIQYTDAEGIRRNKSTGLRTDNPGETVKARTLRAEMEAKELGRTGSTLAGEPWESWVPKYLERHCESDATLTRYVDIWKWLSMWLQVKHHHTPRAITYRNGIEYLEWRMVRSRGRYGTPPVRMGSAPRSRREGKAFPAKWITLPLTSVRKFGNNRMKEHLCRKPKSFFIKRRMEPFPCWNGSKAFRLKRS